jgi:hypothetical protein
MPRRWVVKARNVNRTAAAAAMALLAMSVSGPAQAAGEDKNSDLEWVLARRLNSTTVTKGLHSAYDRPVLLVAQNSCQWQSAMAALKASNSLDAYSSGPQPEPENVNWDLQTAVVVAMGQVPYGYSLDVNEARQNGGRLLLDVHVGYQSYENNLDDDNPVVVLLVDGHGVTNVRAMYDLDVPGLLSQANASSCDAQRAGSSVGGSQADPGSNVSMTWGSLKSLYR